MELTRVSKASTVPVTRRWAVIDVMDNVSFDLPVGRAQGGARESCLKQEGRCWPWSPAPRIRTIQGDTVQRYINVYANK